MIELDRKWYVYGLYDIDTPFYYGKGSGNRMYQHVQMVINNIYDINIEKARKIRNIIDNDREVQQKIIAIFDNEKEAYMYEYALIYMTTYAETLTNINTPYKVHKNHTHKKNSIKEIERIKKQQAKTKTKQEAKDKIQDEEKQKLDEHKVLETNTDILPQKIKSLSKELVYKVVNDFIFADDTEELEQLSITRPLLVSPWGNIFDVSQELKLFCYDYGLQWHKIFDLLKGNINSYQGWTRY